MEFQDYYQILGVPRDADTAAIKQAYRRAARKYHPDRNSDSGAEDRFKAIQEAWEVLQDPEKRRAYDQLGKDWKAGQQFRPPPGWASSGHAGGATGFSDFFEQLFGGGNFSGGFGGAQFGDASDPFGGRSGFQGQGFGRKAAPQELDAQISLEEAYAGTTREIGRPGQSTLKVKVPPGTTDGTKMRVASGGSADILLRIQIQPHRLFQLEGRDVSLDLPLAPWEAALGAKVQVPTLGGPIDMKIPPGSQSGQRLRLKGRGLPSAKGKGDQYLRLQIKNPPLNGAPDQQWFEDWAKAAGSFNPRELLI